MNDPTAVDYTPRQPRIEPAIDANAIAVQRQFSAQTFGPGNRTEGILDHIRKELVEIEEHPTDLYEWVDVLILAIDGAWRAGYSPEAIIGAYRIKMETNMARTWPDWRQVEAGRAIEHVRTKEIETVEGPVLEPGDDTVEIEAVLT
jgi:hypothetical protein